MLSVWMAVAATTGSLWLSQTRACEGLCNLVLWGVISYK